MRILHVTHQYLPEYVGGVELYTDWLTQGLAELGHANVVFYRRSKTGDSLEHRLDGVTSVWAASSGLVSPFQRFKATFGSAYLSQVFEKVFTEVAPDVVHIQHLMGLPLQFLEPLQRMGVPYVVTLHDFWWRCANAQLLTNYSQKICSGPQTFIGCARCALARGNKSRLWPLIPPLALSLSFRNVRLKQILLSAAALIAPTNFVAEWYAQHGFPDKKITVIPHGLDSPDFPVKKVRASGRPLRFLYIGGLSRQKGIHVLVDAFQGVSSKAELWIAGDVTSHPDYVARLRASASDSVRFLGKLSRDEVWATLARVDVVIVPSLWYETFSFIVSEAFAAGLPVVASGIGALQERIKDGKDGFLFPPGDVPALRNILQRLVQDTDLLAGLQRNVQQPSTFIEHAKSIEKVYLGCL